MKIRIATRKSPLAIWQAEHVAQQIRQYHPDVQVELVGMSTQGDKIIDTPLAKIGGKGLFVKELEQGLLSGQADIAVHSMKDVPVELPAGLHLTVILKREDPSDALVCNHYSELAQLPQGAKVGTSSLRRQVQIKAYRPDLQILPLRGNVNTRLNKLDQGEYDAIILASAGLMRLGLSERIRQRLSLSQSLPAIGQGAIGIECRQDDDKINALIGVLHDQKTADCVRAERALNHRLQGGCQVPIAAHAVWMQNRIEMSALIGGPDGTLLRVQKSAPSTAAESLGIELAESLLKQGGQALLDAWL